MIITKEALAETLVSRILGDLYAEYANDKEAHESAQTFDDWMYERLNELGEAAYHVIGDMYGDLDEAIEATR